MRSKFIMIITIIFVASVVAGIAQFYSGTAKLAEPVTVSSSPPRFAVALVPLDSRPPCTQFLVQLADLAGMEIVLPPPRASGQL